MNPLFRLSFRQLLLLAFLLMALLMAAATLRGLNTLEALLSQGRDGARSAQQLSAQVDRLAELGVTMERAARQFLVLGDATLRQIYTRAADDTDAVVQDLALDLADDSLAPRWTGLRQRIETELQRTPGPVAARDARVAQVFGELGELRNSLTESVRSANVQRNAALQAELDAGRRALVRQLLVAVAVSLGLALALALALARPLRRLQSAIAALGENRLDQPIDIRGPADVAGLGRRLDWLRQRLAETDADKARFLRHVSHELKTPLAALREGVALLEDGVAGPLSEQQQEITRILADNTGALQQRIEDLLRFNAAAFAAQRLVRRPTDLAALVHGLVDAQQLQWRARRLQVHAEGAPLKAAVDPELLGTALGNLLSNAIRYSPSAGEVHIRWFAENDAVCITITDQGPGIAADERERIFEPFFRGRRQPEGGLPGTGIGLAIVAETVSAHGGQITLERQPPGDTPPPAPADAALDRPAPTPDVIDPHAAAPSSNAPGLPPAPGAPGEPAAPTADHTRGPGAHFLIRLPHARVP